jgi:rubrerythrin
VPIFYSAVEVIEMAVQTEKAGKGFYEGVAKKTNNNQLKELFDFLAQEETKHQAIFSELYKTIKESPQTMPYNWEELKLYLAAITESRFFLGKDKAINLVKEAKTPQKAIEQALDFERDTMLFYNEITTIVAEKDRPVVTKIIEQEKSHIRKLQALKSTLSGLK